MSKSRWETEIGTAKEGREVVKRGAYQFNMSHVAASWMEKHLSAQKKNKPKNKHQKTSFLVSDSDFSSLVSLKQGPQVALGYRCPEQPHLPCCPKEMQGWEVT